MRIWNETASSECDSAGSLLGDIETYEIVKSSRLIIFLRMQRRSADLNSMTTLGPLEPWTFYFFPVATSLKNRSSSANWDASSSLTAPFL